VSGTASELEGDETITIYLGDTLQLDAHLTDANPSDQVQLFLHVQGEFQTHPSGLIVTSTKAAPSSEGDPEAHAGEPQRQAASAASSSSTTTSSSQGASGNAYSLHVRWAPVVRDTGKTTEMCFVAEGQRYNPTRRAAVYESAPIRRCVTVYVPSCQVRVQQGDTLRSLEKQYQIPWRTLFLINPDLSQAGDGLMEEGQVLRIGRQFRLASPRNTAYRYSLENTSATFSVPYANLYNHNAPSIFRLAAPGALTCSTSDPPETCRVNGFVDPARHVVSDVRFPSLSQTEPYGDISVCLVARFHSNCL